MIASRRILSDHLLNECVHMDEKIYLIMSRGFPVGCTPRSDSPQRNFNCIWKCADWVLCTVIFYCTHLCFKVIEELSWKSHGLAHVSVLGILKKHSVGNHFNYEKICWYVRLRQFWMRVKNAFSMCFTIVEGNAKLILLEIFNLRLRF